MNETVIVRRHYPELDGLRALAMLLVLWWHSSQWAGNMAPIDGKMSVAYFQVSIFGACGVSLFFVLSGFLITGILMDLSKHKNCLKIFYIRRSLRIFPLYYFSLIILMIMSLLYYSDYNYSDHIYSYIFYFQNLKGLYWGDSPFRDENWLLFEHFWSLAVEEQFYLLWPLFFLFIYRHLNFYMALSVMILLIALSLYVRFDMTSEGEWRFAHISTLSRINALIFGAVLVYTLKVKPDIFKCFQKISDIVTPLFPIVIIIFILYVSQLGELFLVYSKYIILLGDIFSLFLLLYVLNRSSREGVIQSILCSRFFKFFAQISYGFYVFHIPVLTVMQYHLQDYTSWNYWSYHAFLFFLGGGITLVISWLSYRYFEKPILNLKHKYAAVN